VLNLEYSAVVACDQADWIIGLKNKRQAELAKSCLVMEKSTPGLLHSPNFFTLSTETVFRPYLWN